MVSRQAREDAKVQSLMAEIVGGARLFLSGGQELPLSTLKDGVEEAEPKARRISLPGATIRSQTELEDWLDQVRAEIEAALGDGPVIL